MTKGKMTVNELSRDQMQELKERYMIELVNNNQFAEHFGVDYDEPSWGDIAKADELVSDEEIIELWEDVTFTDDDFFCTAKREEVYD